MQDSFYLELIVSIGMGGLEHGKEGPERPPMTPFFSGARRTLLMNKSFATKNARRKTFNPLDNSKPQPEFV